MNIRYVRLIAIQGTAFMILMGCVARCSADYWDVGEPISGVGEITQTHPSASTGCRTKLHYSGGSSPCETASFEINVSNATDIDYLYCGDGSGPIAWADAGLKESWTIWQCPAGAGTMANNSFASTFTPSSDIYSHIRITCTVYEGEVYSYSYGHCDASVSTTWDELDTFKVGVTMTPGDIEFWEDDFSYSERCISLPSSNCGLLFANVPWTGLGSRPGAVPDDGAMQAYAMTWTAKAVTQNAVVSGTMGTINYTASIECNGLLRIFGARAGGSLAGSLGTLASSLIGEFANPYIAAAAQCAVGIVGTRTHYKVQLLGKSVLQDGSEHSIGNVSQYVGDDICGVAAQYDLSSLNLQHSYSTQPGVVKCGSLALDSLAQVYDDSIINEGTAIVDVETPGLQYYGSTKPTYSSS